MAGQTAGPIETKLDTRTHVHPGSVSGKVNLKVINVCMREWQKTRENGAKATPGKRCTNYVRTTAEAPSSERNYSATNEARRRKRRAASAERASRASRTPSGGRVIRASNKYNSNTSIIMQYINAVCSAMHYKVHHLNYYATKHCVATKAKSINSFPDRIFPWHFPDSCQTPWHFQVFQKSGHPVDFTVQDYSANDCAVSIQLYIYTWR